MRARLVLIFVMIVLCVTSCAQSPESRIDKRIEEVESGLIRAYGDSPRERMNLAERMAYYNVPGVSIAVINYNQIEWARGYGVLEAGGNEIVTPGTLFQAASVAKPVVAVAALHYVERGLIELDGDVNRSLVSWQVPENALTTREPVTLRRLLSHSAGVTVHGFRGYTQDERIPTLQQILDGEWPANSAPIRVDVVPGGEYRYSGGGYMIVQQLLEDVTDRPFPDIMKDTVLDPWNMTDSTFESPLPDDRWDNAASGHRQDGEVIPGRWHTYPEMGAGASMWTTPSDLARFVIGVMLAYTGQADEVLSQDLAMQMLTPQIASHGLGPAVNDDGGDLLYFMHNGANEGYRTCMVAYPKRGQGVVIMTNGDSGDALWREILNSVSVEYGWVSNHTILYVLISIAVALALLGVLLLRKMRTRRRSV